MVANYAAQSVRLVALTLTFWAMYSPATQAKLAINLRFPDGSTHRQLSAADIGTPVLFEVWASVDNAFAPAGEVNLNGSGSHEGVGYVVYDLISGRAGPNSIVGGLQNGIMVAPFTALRSSPGANVDLNNDGIRDFGINATADIDGHAYARTAGALFDNEALWQEFNLASPIFRPIPNGIEFLMETVEFQVDALAAGDAVSISPRPFAQWKAIHGANWWQDSTAIMDGNALHDGINNGTYFAGTSISFSAQPSGVPEPGTAAMGLVAGAIGLFLTGRRRYRKIL